MRRWLDDVVEIGGEVVFWDEPHLAVQKDEVGRVARGRAAAKSARRSSPSITAKRCR